MIRSRPFTLSAAVLALSAVPARAVEAVPQPQPVLAIVDVVQAGKTTGSAVFIGPDGELQVASRNGSTKIKLHQVRVQGGASDIVFDVERAGDDHESWQARGEIAQPPSGQRVLVARLAEPSGTVEIYLSVAPYGR